MRNLICVCLLIMYASSFGQSKTIALTKDNLKKAQIYPRNTSLSVQCDSVVVFNKTQYDDYVKLKNQALSYYQNLALNCDTIVGLNNKALSDVTSTAKSLIGDISTSVDSAGVILVKTKENLDIAIHNLNVASDNLKATKDLIEAEKKDKWKKPLVWGASGLLVGMLGTMVLLGGK